MSKLCYKLGETVKKYDLKDSVDKPRLAVRSGEGTKYLRLKQGTKSGEISVKAGDRSYYVQTAITIGNARVIGTAYNQTIKDYRNSTNDERILSWLFVNPVNNQIMAMIVYAHTEGNCMGVVQHFAANINGTGGINLSNGVELTQRSGTFGQDFAPSDAPGLSGNIKIGLVNRFGHQNISTKIIHDYLVNPSYDNYNGIYYTKCNNRAHYHRPERYYHVNYHDIYNYRDNTETTSKSSTGRYALPYNPHITCSCRAPNNGYDLYVERIKNKGDWFIGDSPFAGALTPECLSGVATHASVHNFLVGLYKGYPIIEMGSSARNHFSVLAYVEFPYSGYIGMKPYDVIDAWYEVMGDRTYTLASDHDAFAYNGSKIYYPGDELIDI